MTQIDFLVNHRWAKPRRRSSRLFWKTKQSRDLREWVRRSYCVKCGAAKYFRLGPRDHYQTVFRALGDIERIVKHIPPCPGHPIAPTPEGM